MAAQAQRCGTSPIRANRSMAKQEHTVPIIADPELAGK
jgi:hypothetical protein